MAVGHGFEHLAEIQSRKNKKLSPFNLFEEESEVRIGDVRALWHQLLMISVAGGRTSDASVASRLPAQIIWQQGKKRTRGGGRGEQKAAPPLDWSTGFPPQRPRVDMGFVAEGSSCLHFFFFSAVSFIHFLSLLSVSLL